MNTYEIHELANIVAMANELEQQALTEAIRANGQREPAVLWQGKIVDGRCRQLSCQALEIDLKVRHLEDNLTEEQVAAIVQDMNTRRNLTTTQRIASAYKQQLRTGENNSKIARRWAISVSNFKYMKYIAKILPNLVEPLFNGKTVQILDVTTGKHVTTSKVFTIYTLLKKQKEQETLIIDNSKDPLFNPDFQIHTEAGKQWFFQQCNEEPLIKQRRNLMLNTVELANYKYQNGGNNENINE
jgi:hypothetical protein